MKQPLEAFLDHFGVLEDKRETEKVLHPLPEILLVTLCGVIAGAAATSPLISSRLQNKSGIPLSD